MNTNCNSDFKPILSRGFQLEELDAQTSAVIGLWRDAKIAYLNPAWHRFAADNGGQPEIERCWGLGRDYLAAIAQPLRPYYERLLLTAPTRQESLTPRSHAYECSSAQLYRRFIMHVFVLPDDGGRVLINSLAIEAPHDPLLRRPCAPVLKNYLSGDGIVRQCAHCRRVQHRACAERWDWVPDWVEQPVSFISHSMCPICHHYYYPNIGYAERAYH